MKIKIVDDLDPENVAMVQGLYSRSAASVDDHLAKVQASGSKKFWDNYVVGYTHKSIADCGSTTLFIEGVSLLAAKAIQDSPLYSGQETSTRYIDMANQAIINIVDVENGGGDGGISSEILNRWMSFYTKNQMRVFQHVMSTHPRKDGENEDVYLKAVKARTFDILRGFLPAGITTQLSWHTNLRQAGDHLLHLSNHPSSEIREIAKQCRQALADRYPSSGFTLDLPSVSGVAYRGKTPEEIAKAKAEAEARAAWEERAGKTFSYGPRYPVATCDFGHTFEVEALPSGMWSLLRDRPRGCVIPHQVTAAGMFHWAFLLDFGSFRDLQRHRNGVCRMPLLTTDLGFEPWYLNQLDAELRDEAAKLITDQTSAIECVSGNPVVRQYYTALGFRVRCEVAYGLPAAVYVAEMRSARTVHPTLRAVVLGWMVPHLREVVKGIALHVDEGKDDWTTRRGLQTITEKGFHHQEEILGSKTGPGRGL